MAGETATESVELFHRRRYIETDFPFERLSVHVKREKHAMKPVYQMHSWFARRAGSVFRAIIAGLLLEEGSKEDEFWELFYTSAKSLDLICLDPMMGGGSAIIEALRMGCRGVIGVDLNPVAWFVTKKEVEPVELAKLDEEFRSLEQRVRPEITRFYVTRCRSCGALSDLVHAYWVKEIECEGCHSILPLYQYYALAKVGEAAWIYCPHCNQCAKVSSDRDVLGNPRCPTCRRYLKPTSNGRKYFCNCGNAGQVLNAVRSANRLPDMRLFALQYECPDCKVLACKVPETEDLGLVEDAGKSLKEKREYLPIPSLEIIDGEETRRIINYGYKRFDQLFNDRQLLSLGILLREISAIDDQNIMEFLLLAFSKCLEFNNILVPYVYSGNKVESCFSLHEYLHAQVFVENNVWGSRYGRGTFVKCYRNVRGGKEYCQRPYERKHENLRGKILTRSVPIGPKINARLVESFAELKTGNQSALLHCQSAEDLSFIPRSSVDLVLTDPPYFDNVIYSGLADFFYAWLKASLARRYSWMKELNQSPRDDEIVVNKKVSSKDDEAYLDAMTRVFGQCAKVLKRDGILAFTFHHTKKRAWFSIMSALLDAGFYVSSAWPVHSESRASPHLAGPRSIQFDVILTCRRRDGDGDFVEWSALKRGVQSVARRILRKLSAAHLDLSEEDVRTIVIGKCMELYSKHYPNVVSRGEKVDLLRAIKEIETAYQALPKERRSQRHKK